MQMRQDICLKWKGYKHMEKEYFVMDDDGMDTEITSEMEAIADTACEEGMQKLQ